MDDKQSRRTGNNSSAEIEEAYLKGQEAKMISWDSINPFSPMSHYWKAWNKGFNEYQKRSFRPTYKLWERILLDTKFESDESFMYSSMQCIDFDENEIHLKSGKRLKFNGLTEKEFLDILARQ